MRHVGSSWTQGSNLCLLHWQADSLPLSHQGSPITRYLKIQLDILCQVHTICIYCGSWYTWISLCYFTFSFCLVPFFLNISFSPLLLKKKKSNIYVLHLTKRTRVLLYLLVSPPSTFYSHAGSFSRSPVFILRNYEHTQHFSILWSIKKIDSYTFYWGNLITFVSYIHCVWFLSFLIFICILCIWVLSPNMFLTWYFLYWDLYLKYFYAPTIEFHLVGSQFQDQGDFLWILWTLDSLFLVPGIPVRGLKSHTLAGNPLILPGNICMFLLSFDSLEMNCTLFGCGLFLVFFLVFARYFVLM